MSDIKIEGLEQLVNRLKQLRTDNGRIVEQGLMRGGERVRGHAVLLCPAKTGALRNSIQVEKAAPLTVSVGTNMEYAVFVEYGTGTKGDPEVPHTSKESWRWQDEDGNWHTSHGQKPQPFLRPAAKEEFENVKQEVAGAIRRGINGG